MSKFGSPVVYCLPQPLQRRVQVGACRRNRGLYTLHTALAPQTETDYGKHGLASINDKHVDLEVGDLDKQLQMNGWMDGKLAR